MSGGDPSRSWRQYYRGEGPYEHERRDSNRTAMRRQVTTARMPHGVLAYDGGQPSGGVALRPPVLAADAGYGDCSQFRAALDERGIGYIVQVKGDALAHESGVAPVERVWSGQGRPPTRTDPHYPATAVSPAAHVTDHVATAGRAAATTITWRERLQRPDDSPRNHKINAACTSC